MNSHSHCDNCFKLNCDHILCKIIDCQQAGCEFRMHECKQQDHLDGICSRVRVPCINSEFGCNLFMVRGDLRTHLERCPASVVSCSFVNNNKRRDHCCWRWNIKSKFKDHFKQHETIRDDSTLSSNIEAPLTDGELNEFNQSPKQKQVCDSNFRRDEYGSHYQNVHCDIMSSLNGWMEKFCPNQQYGCPFNTRRIRPTCNNQTTQIVFSKQSRAFGHLVVDNQNTNLNNRTVNLTDLPVELITHILSHLDAFSLNNISLTNKLLRSVCCNLLERRGLVSLAWQRGDEFNRWTVAGYKWSFSNHFSLIDKWEFDDGPFLNHFANGCKHFDKLINEEPFALMGIGMKPCESGDKTWDSLEDC